MFNCFKSRNTVAINNQELIIEKLSKFCSRAAQRHWQGAGLASFVIAADNKEEKSTALMNFINLAGARFPNIIVMYINFEDQQHKKLGLVNRIKDKLQHLGHAIEDQAVDVHSNQWLPIIRTLSSKNMYLLLLLDNIEELYFLDPNEYPDARAIVMGVHALGNLYEGRIGTAIFGSMALPELLFNPSKYPEATFRYDFNHTKFPVMSLRM